MEFSHLDRSGHLAMVDVSAKPGSFRTAQATGYIVMQLATIALLTQESLPKGNVLTTAKLAGILAAKNTAHLIPLCHQLAVLYKRRIVRYHFIVAIEGEHPFGAEPFHVIYGNDGIGELRLPESFYAFSDRPGRP